MDKIDALSGCLFQWKYLSVTGSADKYSYFKDKGIAHMPVVGCYACAYVQSRKPRSCSNCPLTSFAWGFGGCNSCSSPYYKWRFSLSKEERITHALEMVRGIEKAIEAEHKKRIFKRISMETKRFLRKLSWWN